MTVTIRLAVSGFGPEKVISRMLLASMRFASVPEMIWLASQRRRPSASPPGFCA
jgi:hypothetical protein